MEELTPLIVGAVVSIISALLAPKEPEAPGDDKVRVALFPALSFIKELTRFKDAEFIWCQEEPKNQGGWSFVEPNLEWSLNRVNAKCKRAKFVGRAAAASPATGLAIQHKEQQETIINEALTIN